MLRRVSVSDAGDTNFLIEEHVEKHIFEKENERIIMAGGQPAKGDALARNHAAIRSSSSPCFFDERGDTAAPVRVIVLGTLNSFQDCGRARIL